MKRYLIVFIALCFCSVVVKAQTDNPDGFTRQRNIRIDFIKGDSVNLTLNSEFDLIEDSCSVVIRQVHLNREERVFYGPVKDVSRLDPKIIVTEGFYNKEGFKDGYFITRYLNGNLQARGNFKNDSYDGKWELFYEDGRPKVIFEANGSKIKIMEAWDNKGKKYIIDGKGNYAADYIDVVWKGKLLNGLPDGTWRAIRLDDATNTSLATERYKDGVFQKGTRGIMEYTDEPKLAIIRPDMLLFTRAENMAISSMPCDGAVKPSSKHIVNAQYRNGGFTYFSERIKALATPVISEVDITVYEDKLTLLGEVSEKGTVRRLTAHNVFNQKIARGLIQQFAGLPAMEPATIDGKPVIQKFEIIFAFSNGSYSFTYKLLPLKVD